jgi:hypothetical protein
MNATTLRTLTNRTLALMDKASRATERMAAHPTPRNVRAEREAWEAYARARTREVEARRATRK